MILQTKKILSICFCMVGSVCFSAPEEAMVEVPEIEIERALTALSNVDHTLKSLEILNSEFSEGASVLSAKRSLQNAREYFAKEMFLAAIREVLTYQRSTQTPDAAEYMQSLYILGRCYQSVGMESQALHAYLRYVAIHTTADTPNNTQLLQVLHYAMPLAVSYSAVTSKDLKKLFSAVAGIDLSKTQKAEVFYYAANSARISGEKEIASEWFEKSANMSSDPNLASRSKYFYALLLLDEKKFDEAKKLLLENVSDVKESNSEFVGYSYLALARISMSTNKPADALSYYEKVGKSSSLYKDALFESIYAHLDNDQNTEARNSVDLFLKSFPGDNRVFQLKSLMSYFYLKDGKWDDAKLMMSEADQELTKYRVWVDQKYSKSSRISRGDIDELVEIGDPRISHSPDVLLGHKLFGKLAEAKRRISDSRANLRNLIYTLGRTNISQFKPSWIHRGTQYQQLSESVLLIGHRLISSITNTIRPMLSDLEKDALDSSQKRRFELFSVSSKIKRRNKVWASWSNALDLTKDIADKQEAIRKLQAKLASVRFVDQMNSSDKQASDTKFSSIASSIAKIEEQLYRSLELVRSQKTLEVIKQSPHRSVKSLHAQYANLLNEEFLLVDQFMQANTGHHSFAVFDSFSTAWKRWEFVDKSLFQNVSRFDALAESQLKSSIDQIQSLIVKHEALSVRQQILLSSLEEEMSASIKPIVSFYHDKLDDQMANTQKWQADLDWLEYEKNSDDKLREQQKFQLEQQILKNSMRDIGQGAL